MSQALKVFGELLVLGLMVLFVDQIQLVYFAGGQVAVLEQDLADFELGARLVELLVLVLGHLDDCLGFGSGQAGGGFQYFWHVLEDVADGEHQVGKSQPQHVIMLLINISSIIKLLSLSVRLCVSSAARSPCL